MPKALLLLPAACIYPSEVPPHPRAGLQGARFKTIFFWFSFVLL